uniref:Uncharacterized protein n=1 Tax=Hyaloperonospora arabidopsidis (strain Emoy2) TaxID=559515 RepID=M4BW79_HYAAE
MRRAVAPDTADPITGSKLRASRVRRQRHREQSLDADDLEQRFSRSASLSLAAPAFVPAAQRLRQPPAASAALNRSLAFVTNRRGPTAAASSPASIAASSRPRRSATAAVASKLYKNAAARKPQPQQQLQQQQTKNRPSSCTSAASSRSRRQRMGAKGLNPQPSIKSTAVSTSERHRRKLSLTSTELQPPDASLEQQVETTPASASAAAVQDAADVYPETASSAFPQQLTLFSQQKRLPQRVASRDDVIDTIFTALFCRRDEGRRRRPRQALSAFGDEGTDTDEPNEELVKQGLATALFKSQLQLHAPSSLSTAASPAAAADSLLTPTFLHALVNALRFEDFRVASVRLDILRAIHKSCPTKRVHLVRALADATALRIEYVTAVAARAEALGVEKTSRQVTADKHDHGHGFTELLRYSIEHVEESLQEPEPPSLLLDESDAARKQEEERTELVRNCMVSLVSLWRAHWVDPAGSDDEELVSCAGQFVAYMPSVTGPLLKRLLSGWPTRYPKEEVGATRMVARVIMSGPPLEQVDPTHSLQRRVFTRLARALQSPKVDVAMEVLAFVSCNFVLVHFLRRDEALYKTITQALHANIESHWHDGVRKTSETHFDRALDFAP